MSRTGSSVQRPYHSSITTGKEKTTSTIDDLASSGTHHSSAWLQLWEVLNMALGFLKRCMERLRFDGGHIKDDGKWITVEVYRKKYLTKLPCNGTKRCPNANDTYCAECEVKK